MAEEQAVPQKSRKRHRLEGIEVHTVGFVDSPAVGGSEFIIAKAYTEDGMEQTTKKSGSAYAERELG